MTHTFKFQNIEVVSDYPEALVLEHLGAKLRNVLLEEKTLNREPIRITITKTSLRLIGVPIARELQLARVQTSPSFDYENYPGFPGVGYDWLD